MSAPGGSHWTIATDGVKDGARAALRKTVIGLTAQIDLDG